MPRLPPFDMRRRPLSTPQSLRQLSGDGLLPAPTLHRPPTL